jgi:polynucleotide 5'-kinase involved in rRNA processing
MILDNYKSLIQNLPVRQQSFTTKRDNEKWIRAEKNNSWFKEFNDHHFRNGKLPISRQDIFSIENSPREKIIKTIFWGYPNGMQGGHNSFKG